MDGIVVELQARMRIIFRLPGRSEVELECVVDTGFEGFLTLPPAVIMDFGLSYLAEINANLANNSNVMTDVYLATIVWDSKERNIAVLAMGGTGSVGWGI